VYYESKSPLGMIWEIKAMIAGCIDKMRLQGCGTCDHRDACSFVVPELLGFLMNASRPGRERPKGEGKPFLKFLGEMGRRMERRSKPRPAPLSRKVEAQIEPLLAGGGVRVEAVARTLGLSRQTLYRRLKEEGTSFERLLDSVRRRLALRLVREQGLSVKEASYRLGFKSPTVAPRIARPIGEVQAIRPLAASVSSSPTRVTMRWLSSSSARVTTAPKNTLPRSGCRAGSTTCASFIRFESQLMRRSTSRSRLRP
jgi:AraC-like DNA-binding protein